MLTDPIFAKYAAGLGVPMHHIKAVAEVETVGSGFTPDGQPRILFEAHKFSEHTNHAYDRSHPQISSRSWNRSLYAKGPNADTRSMAEHKRLQEAAALDRNAALMSASWGRFQVMGENHALCQYGSLQEFINAAYRDEEAHLDMFARFIRGKTVRLKTSGRNLLEALKVGDWTTFAHLYNGAGYAENQYDKKMAAAAKKYAP